MGSPHSNLNFAGAILPGVAGIAALLTIAIRRSRVLSQDMSQQRFIMGMGDSRFVQSPMTSTTGHVLPITSAPLLPQVDMRPRSPQGMETSI
jgi:hypothetical protein